MGVPMEGWNDCPDLPDVTTTTRKVSSGRKKRPQRVGHDFGPTSIPTPTQSPSPPSAMRIPSATLPYPNSPMEQPSQTQNINQLPLTPSSTSSLPIPTGACRTAGTATQVPVLPPPLSTVAAPIPSPAS